MPDKPAGRGLKLQESAVKRYAVSAGLPLLQPTDLKAEEFIAELTALRPDLGIVVAFRMLPRAVFELPRYGTFNLHASLLPQYRGAAPINWALINGERETGVTTFMLNPRMDEGAVIASRRVAIADDDNAGTLHDKLMTEGARLVAESVNAVAADGFRPEPQAMKEELKPAPKIFKETCHVDFMAEGVRIVNLVRGVSPYPGAWAMLRERAVTDGVLIREGSVKFYSVVFLPDADVADAPGSVAVENGTMSHCLSRRIYPTAAGTAGRETAHGHTGVPERAESPGRIEVRIGKPMITTERQRLTVVPFFYDLCLAPVVLKILPCCLFSILFPVGHGAVLQLKFLRHATGKTNFAFIIRKRIPNRDSLESCIVG